MGVQGRLKFLFPAPKLQGQGHVKDQVGMAGAPDHPEIVEGQAAVLFLQEIGAFAAHPVELRVVGDHGVVVDHQMDVVAAQAFPFHVVDALVAVQGIVGGVHLHVEAGKPLTGAVVVDHQVVVAQDLGLLAHIIHDQRLQLGAGGFAQQGGDGLLCQTPAGEQDEHRHTQTHEAVHGYVEEMLDDARGQNGAGGHAVVAAVGGGGLQGGGGDHFAQLPVEQEQPHFHNDGSQQHRHGDAGEFHGGGIQNLLHGGFCQLEADEHDHHCHRQAG